MHRFFIPKGWFERDRVSLKAEPAHQIADVLRLKPFDHIVVLDNSGWEYEVEIEKVSSELVHGKVIGKDFCPAEPGVKITLYQSLLKSDKFEFVLQKGVELGVSAFVPLISERCVVRKPGETKMQRWEKIIREAAEQSRRGLLPVLNTTISFKKACELAGRSAILLWEGEKSTSLRQILTSNSFQSASALNIFVGPEGGFAPAEVKYAESRGIVAVGLGRRILRAETAGLAAVSAILYERRELE